MLVQIVPAGAKIRNWVVIWVNLLMVNAILGLNFNHRKMGKYLSFLSFLFLLAGCGGEEVITSNDSTRTEPRTIQNIIAEQQPISFPFRNHIEESCQDCSKVLPKDSAYFMPGALVNGYLPDTASYYGFVYYINGDYSYPYLRTFNKQGNILADSQLSGFAGVDECEKKSSEVFFQNQSEFDIVSVRIDQNCEGYDLPPDRFIVETYRTKGNIATNGLIIVNNSKPSTLTFDTTLLSIIDASTQKYVFEDSLVTQTLWVVWKPDNIIYYQCSVFYKIDECQQYLKGSAQIYLEDDLTSDEDGNGRYPVYEYYTLNYTGAIINSIRIDSRNRDKARLVINDNSYRVCTFKENIMYMQRWF